MGSRKMSLGSEEIPSPTRRLVFAAHLLLHHIVSHRDLTTRLRRYCPSAALERNYWLLNLLAIKEPFAFRPRTLQWQHLLRLRHGGIIGEGSAVFGEQNF